MTPIEQFAKQCGAEFTDWQNGEPPEITFYGGMPQLELFVEALRQAIIKDYQQSAEYEAMKELVTLIKVARAWYWVAGDVDDEYRGHEMYPTQHASNKSPMWSAIENQLKAIAQARKQNAI